MADVIINPPITLDDLLKLGAEDRRVELHGGELVEMSPTGFLHVAIAANIYDLLRPHAIKHQLGYVLGDGLIYVLQAAEGDIPRETRLPDVSFIRAGRLPKDWDRVRPFPGAPSLAIEVVSPTDEAVLLRRKIHDYLVAGTEQVWVVYPTQQEIQVYTRQNGREYVEIYTVGDILRAESLFPELEIAIADCFRLEDFEG